MADDGDHVLSRRNASMMDECAEEDHDQMILKLNQGFANSKDRSIWSYKFPIKNIDDFQIALPNINRLPDRVHGWSITS